MNWLPNIGNLFSRLDRSYFDVGMQIFGGRSFSTYNRRQMMDLVLSNPAFIKVVALQCDTFSMGKFYAYDDNDKEVKPDLLDRLKNPRGTTPNQFLWDVMFWLMMGDVFVWVPNKSFEDMTKFIVLNPLNMEIPPEIQFQKIYISKNGHKELEGKEIRYHNPKNSQVLRIKWGEIIHITDLSNTMTGELFGLSRLDSLYKIIVNSEEALTSKKINTEFSRKFLVAGSVDAMDVTKKMLSPAEKDDIEKKIMGPKPVHAVKSMIDIRRFIENMKNLELSKSYQEDYFLIGNMYNIPRDVLEAFNSSTYENQEKARAMHVAYVCEPKGEILGQELSRHFGLEGVKIVTAYDHLPFVQVLEKGREETKQKKLENLKTMLDMGIDQKEALKYVDLDFKPFNYEKPVNTSNERESQESGGEGGQTGVGEGT